MRPPSFRSLVPFALALCAAAGSSSCATIVGTATGALTGFVDGPAEVARHNEEFFEENPDWWFLDVFVVAPLSLAAGPLFGLVKGVAVDVRALRGETGYGEAFGRYTESSVWRPYSYGFETRKERALREATGSGSAPASR